MRLEIKENDKVLIIAPHPDDETIGCGGLLAMYGKQCDILQLTDGRKGYRSSDKVDEQALVETRAQELRCAARIAKVHNVTMLGIPDGCVQLQRKKIQSFDITPYTMVFVPNASERHKDHCVVRSIVEKMCRKQKSRAKIFDYEVWSPIVCPTHCLDIGDVIDIKMEMIAQYRSQNKYVDYVGMTRGLAQYRGPGFGAQYAEVYALPHVDDFAHRLYRRFPSCIKKTVRRLIKR